MLHFVVKPAKQALAKLDGFEACLPIADRIMRMDETVREKFCCSEMVRHSRKKEVDNCLMLRENFAVQRW